MYMLQAPRTAYVSMIRRSAFAGHWKQLPCQNKIAIGRSWSGPNRNQNMIVDTALQHRENAGQPIRVGMVGAGATGRAIALQLGTPAPGIRLVAIANRTPEHSERAFRESGAAEWKRVDSA